MGMACTICNHVKRIEIDRELVEGKSVSSIARKYGVSNDSLSNHKENHLSRQLTKAYEMKQADESLDLLSKIETILSRAEKIFKRNYAAKKDGLALKALDSSRATIELLAKIAAFLHESRSMELQTSRQEVQARERQESQQLIEAALDRLNPTEASMFGKLIAKANGETKEDVLPYQKTVWPKWKSEAVKEIEPIEEIEPEKMTRTRKAINPLAIKPDTSSSHTKLPRNPGLWVEG